MSQKKIDAMAMFAPKQGKQPTKGQRKIDDENRSTINFYMTMSLIATSFNLLYTTLMSKLSLLSLSFATIWYGVALISMMYMAKPSSGSIDLNLKSGFSDHLKDLIITTAICQCLASFSNLFWILWFLLPTYLFYLLWINFIWPWFSQSSANDEEEISDKKKRKMERKMMRTSYR